MMQNIFISFALEFIISLKKCYLNDKSYFWSNNQNKIKNKYAESE